ncbi:hypothetical protein PQX77_015713 [Marasmius sp. AFHP31]|nr:hypothetical protein PQX77_015713 [Marasmius sp. AFHP31]
MPRVEKYNSMNHCVSTIHAFRRTGPDGRESRVHLFVTVRDAIEFVLSSPGTFLMNFVHPLFVVSCYAYDTLHRKCGVLFTSYDNYTPVHAFADELRSVYANRGLVLSTTAHVSSTLRSHTAFTSHRCIGDDACLLLPGPLYWSVGKRERNAAWDSIAVNSWSHEFSDSGSLRIRFASGGNCLLRVHPSYATCIGPQMGHLHPGDKQISKSSLPCTMCSTEGVHKLNALRDLVQTVVRRSREDQMKGIHDSWGHFLKTTFMAVQPTGGSVASKLFTLLRGISCYFRASAKVKIIFDSTNGELPIRVVLAFDNEVNIWSVRSAIVAQDDLRSLVDERAGIDIACVNDVAEVDDLDVIRSKSIAIYSFL